MGLTIKRVVDEAEFKEALELRYQVFVDEQGVPRNLERDDDDLVANHVLVQDNGKTVGCGRIVIKEDYGKIGRIAVAKSSRKQGVGTMVCQELIEIAKEKGYKKVKLHAQLNSKGFYKRIGFQEFGDKFMEAGIPHIMMVYMG